MAMRSELSDGLLAPALNGWEVHVPGHKQAEIDDDRGCRFNINRRHCCAHWDISVSEWSRPRHHGVSDGDKLRRKIRSDLLNDHQYVDVRRAMVEDDP